LRHFLQGLHRRRTSSSSTGIKVAYSSSENYEQQIVIDTQAGSPPDIAILPQPGLIGRSGLQGPSDDAW
jgi:ABC-type glycerol-3-phosphate transport system substrate-binding protein